MEKQERDMGMLVHLASFAGYLIPFGTILGPLIVWLMKREEFEFVDVCGRNCLNFKISQPRKALTRSLHYREGIAR